MKHIKISSIILLAIITLSFIVSISAQRMRPTPNTNSKMLYHDGPVMTGAQDIYFIWYGCWTDTCGPTGNTDTIALVTDFASSIGGSPYMQMNSLYPNAAGQAPTGALFYGGSIFDQFSHGFELTEADLRDIVRQHLDNGNLPYDPVGIYVVVGSAHVSATAIGFCTGINTPAHHGISDEAFGVRAKYGFVGNPNRCPSLEAPQFTNPDGTRLATPNGDFAGDSIASNLAHVLNTIVTDPYKNAWYDRYGLESAAKCQGMFGTTYTTANGARANIRLNGRDYLIQQNWVNDRRGRCAMHMGL